MSWRTVVISKLAKLDKELGYLVVRGEKKQRVPLGEIAMLIVESTAVSLTAALLAELTARNIGVVFCDEKRYPCAQLLPLHQSHDSSYKLRQQLRWREEIKGKIWTELVRVKIQRQKDALTLFGVEKASVLADFLEDLEYNDSSNREGPAAKVYFAALFGKGFTRAVDSPVNAGLNYGYALLLSACCRLIASRGYVTQLGIHHDNGDNPFNLGSDFMEPLRPFVDVAVCRLWREGKLVDFETEEKHALLEVLNRQVLYDNKKFYLNKAIDVYCQSVLDSLNEGDESLLRFCSFLENEKADSAETQPEEFSV